MRNLRNVSRSFERPLHNEGFGEARSRVASRDSSLARNLLEGRTKLTILTRTETIPMNITCRHLPLCAALALSCHAISGCATSPAGTMDALGESEQSINESECPADVPAALAPDTDQTLKAIFTGVGVQIYVCNGVSAWKLVAPQANLLNDSGKLVGTHFIGPTWQGNDGSSVVGGNPIGVTVNSSAIQWLLLTAVSHGSVSGRFSDVTSIQRLSTVGGLAPSSVCDAAHAGAITQVPYSAEYVFYTTKAHGAVKQCGPT